MDVYKVLYEIQVKLFKIRTKREIHSKFLFNVYNVHLSFRLHDKIWYHLLPSWVALGTKVVLLLNFGLLFFLAYSGFDATFTSLGESGKDGPTSLGSHYTGQDHDGQVTLSSGIQQWTVPYTGQYRIEAVGAAGGYDTFSTFQHRGRGARIVGIFNLSQGEIIQILVGQEGGIRHNDSSSEAGGGGGGTFVVRASNTPLIVAGGGGGVRAVISRYLGCDASTNKSGNPGHNSWPGGSNGHGAMTGYDKPSGKRDKDRSFTSYFLSLFQYESEFDLYENQPEDKLSHMNGFSATKTRFDIEANGNSETAHIVMDISTSQNQKVSISFPMLFVLVMFCKIEQLI